MTDPELHLREAIIAKCRWMNATGLNQGTSGNISARHGNMMLISPSATPYDLLTPDMIAATNTPNATIPSCMRRPTLSTRTDCSRSAARCVATVAPLASRKSG